MKRICLAGCVWLLCGLGLLAAAETKDGGKPASVKVDSAEPPARTVRRTDPYALIGEARKLISARQIPDAENLLSELVRTNRDNRILVEAFRVQSNAAQARGDMVAAQEFYLKIFDLVLKPKPDQGDVCRIGEQVMMLLNECDAMLTAKKMPGLDEALRRQVTGAVEARRTNQSKVLTGTEIMLLNEHKVRAANAKRLGKNQEAVAEYEYIFKHYPQVLQEPTSVSAVFAWIEAHGFGRNSPERIQLLENLYNDPQWHVNPRIANVGVHLGTAYEVTRNPDAFTHWQRVVEQIERFRADPATPKDVQSTLTNNYEFSLVSYASMLKDRGKLEEAKPVLYKILMEIPNGEGAKYADRTLKEIEQRKGK